MTVQIGALVGSGSYQQPFGGWWQEVVQNLLSHSRPLSSGGGGEGGIKGTGEARGEAKIDLASSPDATLGYGS